MLDVLFADALEPLAVDNVVVAIGQREAGLSELRNLLGGVFLVLTDAKAEQRRGTALGLELAHQLAQIVRILQIGDALEFRLDGVMLFCSMRSVFMQAA